MAERSLFLEGIRTALGVGSPQERSAEQFPAVFSQPDVSGTLAGISNRSTDERQALLDHFQKSAAEIRLRVHFATDHDAAAATIAEIVRGTEPEFGTDKQIIQHEDQQCAALRLAERLAGDGVTVHTVVPGDPGARDKTAASFVGITVADWGIADSATVVQITGPGKPRSTSLVPSVHIALLPIGRLLADLSELGAVLQDRPPASSCVFISGPSKTGDIESHLVYGAHGPKDMHVIVLTGKEEFVKSFFRHQHTSLLDFSATWQARWRPRLTI